MVMMITLPLSLPATGAREFPVLCKTICIWFSSHLKLFSLLCCAYDIIILSFKTMLFLLQSKLKYPVIYNQFSWNKDEMFVV